MGEEISFTFYMQDISHGQGEGLFEERGKRWLWLISL